MTRNRGESPEPWGSRPLAYSAWIAGLHLFALSGFAVAQPLYDAIGRAADFLVAHDARAADVVALVLAVSALLPMALLAAEVAVALVSRRASRWLHRGLVGLLLGLTVLGALKQGTPLPAPLLLGLAIVVGGAGAAAYARLARLRGFVGLLSLAALVFPLYFVFATPVTSLLRSDPISGRAVAHVGSTTPIVLVVLDEFATFSIMDEAEQIDPHRYPHLAALAADAYWFRNATTVVQNTTYSVPAILSGRYPDRKRLATAADYPETLLTLLAGSYELRVLESVTSLCPGELCSAEPGARFGERLAGLLSDVSFVLPHLLLPAELTRGLPSVTSTWRDFGGSDEGARPSGKTGQFARFLAALRSGRDSTLYFIHLELPHVPWKFLPSGKWYGPPGMQPRPHGLRKDESWENDDWSIVQAFQRYLLQVGYVDHLIGKLTATLREAGLYDSCLLVVVADHGVSFRPGDSRREITDSNLADILNVPLLVKLPWQREGVASDRNVQTIDILATIADALELEIPWPIDGRSAIDPTLPDEPVKYAFPSVEKSGPGEPLVLEVGSLAGRRESLEQMLDLFGSGSRPDGLFRIGPRPELLGRPLSDQLVRASDALVVELHPTLENLCFDPQGSFAPTHITGRVVGEGAGDAALVLAVAVNGVVRAVTRTYDRQERNAHFTAMVPESALAPQMNRIELFALSETAAGLVLRPIPRRRTRVEEAFSLTRLASDGETLRRGDRTIPIVAGAVDGSVDELLYQNLGWVMVKGWAADIAAGRAAERVVTFTDGQLVGTVELDQARPDVVRAFGSDRILQSGFEAVLPLHACLDGRSDPRLRLFAVSGRGVASELTLPAARTQ